MDYIVAKNRRVEIALRQGFEGVHRYKPGKSKLLLVLLSSWYGEKNINQSSDCMQNARDYVNLFGKIWKSSLN